MSAIEIPKFEFKWQHQVSCVFVNKAAGYQVHLLIVHDDEDRNWTFHARYISDTENKWLVHDGGEVDNPDPEVRHTHYYKNEVAATLKCERWWKSWVARQIAAERERVLQSLQSPPQ